MRFFARDAANVEMIEIYLPPVTLCRYIVIVLLF